MCRFLRKLYYGILRTYVDDTSYFSFIEILPNLRRTNSGNCNNLFRSYLLIK